MTRFASEYGNALFELAEDESLSDHVAQDLRRVMALINQQEAYIRLLGVPSIDVKERKGLIDEAFGESVHPYLVNFMKLLIDRGAIAYLPECADVFFERYNDAKGIAVAKVTSAAALTSDQISALREKLEQISGKNVEMRLDVDPDLIGGLRVDMLGKRYDNSVRDRLDKLRRSLTAQE